MRIIWSILAWFVVTVVVAAAIEIVTGQAHGGLVPLVSLPFLAPVLIKIWRRPSHP